MKDISDALKIILGLLLSVWLLFAICGCASTTVTKTMFDNNGKKAGELKLSATSFLVKRDLGKVTLEGVGSLDGSKSDQMAAASEALSLAAAALRK